MKSRQPKIKKSDGYIHTDITIGGKATFKKTLYVQGASEYHGTSAFSGDATFKANAIIDGALSVSSVTNLDGPFLVYGESTFNNDVDVRSQLKCKSFSSDGPSKLKDTRVDGDLLCLSNAAIIGKASMTQGHVGEFLEVRGYLSVDSWLKVGKELITDGSAKFKQNIFVDGDSTVCGSFVSGYAEFNDNVLIKNGLKVAGESTLSGHAVCKKSLLIKDKLEVKGNLYANQNILTNGVSTERIVVTEEANINNLGVLVDANIAGNLYCSYAGVKEKISVGGDAHFKKGVAVDGVINCKAITLEDITTTDDVSVGGSLDVTNAMHVGGNSKLASVECKSISIPDGSISSGSYYPNLLNGQNLNLGNQYDCHYMRVGNVVTVSGRIDIQPEIEKEVSKLQIDLPIQTKLVETGSLSGMGVSQDGLVNIVCFGDVISNRCTILYTPQDTEKCAFFFNFTYRVLD